MNNKLASKKAGVGKGGIKCHCCTPVGWTNKQTRTAINRLMRRSTRQIVWRKHI